MQQIYLLKSLFLELIVIQSFQGDQKGAGRRASFDAHLILFPASAYYLSNIQNYGSNVTRMSFFHVSSIPCEHQWMRFYGKTTFQAFGSSHICLLFIWDWFFIFVILNIQGCWKRQHWGQTGYRSWDFQGFPGALVSKESLLQCRETRWSLV